MRWRSGTRGITKTALSNALMEKTAEMFDKVAVIVKASFEQIKVFKVGSLMPFEADDVN